MNQLEKTIIKSAKHEIKSVLGFYDRLSDGFFTTDELFEDYHTHHEALITLLALAHQANSGMSEEAVSALLAIEEKHTAARFEVDVPTICRDCLCVCRD